jgi:lipase chaperone LimK
MKEHRLPSGMQVAGATVGAAIVVAAIASSVLPSPVHEEPPAPRASATPHLSGAMSANSFVHGGQMAPLPTPAVKEQAATNADTATGVFRTDEKGGLLLDDATRIRLDILQSNLPKNATQQEIHAVEVVAVAGLPADIASKALRILHAYLAYSAAEPALTASDITGATAKPEQMLDRLSALRRQYLGNEIAAALFGTQETQERFGLQLAALDTDTTLTVQQKLARIDAMQQALPEGAVELHANLDASRTALALDQQVAALRAQGASEAQVQQLREQHLGIEGARSRS